MRRVLIIGSDFSPSSLPPALRVRFFARNLPACGWRPTVLSVDSRHYEHECDLRNDKLLPRDLEVVRTGALPARLTRKIGIGDLGLRSLWPQWRACVELCSSHAFDAVLIPVPPYAPAVLGRLIHRRFHLPYVIDYIDPWVSDYWKSQPRAARIPKRRLSDLLSRILEPRVLSKVAHVVGVSSATTEGVVARYPWLANCPTTEIPYGGEEADFEYLLQNPGRNTIFDGTDGNFHLSYVGRGGGDMLPAVRSVFEAVQSGRRRSPELFNQLRLHFVGTSYSAGATRSTLQVKPLAEEMGLEAVVDEHPPRVPYLDALQILLDSQALLAVGSETAHYTASKIFPYVLARKPLLAIFHEASSVVRILSETRAGEAITFGTSAPPSRCVEAVRARLGELLRSPAPPPTDWSAFEGYSTRATAGRLAKVLDAVCSKSSVRAAPFAGAA